MSFIFLLGAVQALFFVVLITSKKQRHKSDYLLITWLLFMGIQLLSYYLFDRKLYDSTLSGIRHISIGIPFRVTCFAGIKIFVVSTFIHLRFAKLSKTGWTPIIFPQDIFNQQSSKK